MAIIAGTTIPLTKGTKGDPMKREEIKVYILFGDSFYPVGRGATSGGLAYDRTSTSETDVFGVTKTTYNDPIITYPLSGMKLQKGDEFASWLLDTERKKGYTGFTNVELLLVQEYMATAEGETGVYAEIHAGSSATFTSLDGDGGDYLVADVEVGLSNNKEMGTIPTITDPYGAILKSAFTKRTAEPTFASANANTDEPVAKL